jgi:hypothetical protein
MQLRGRAIVGGLFDHAREPHLDGPGARNLDLIDYRAARDRHRDLSR